MASFLDQVPVSAIIKIRDLMHTVKDPFRLDQGDVSFDAPDTVKQAMAKAITDNRTHYLPTTGVPRLRQLLAEKMRRDNGIPIGSDDEIVPSNGGTHGIWAIFHALFEPGDEVIVSDPEWPATMAIGMAAKAKPVMVPLHERAWAGAGISTRSSERSRRKRARSTSTRRTTRAAACMLKADLERIAAIAQERDLWVLSDEAYEHILFSGTHVSIASLPGMYERTIPIYTFSKSYAMTGLRLGYFAIQDATLRARATKVIAYTTNNVNSVVQYGGIGALEGSQDCIAAFQTELKARRDLFYAGLADAAPGIFSGAPPEGTFYAFVKINPEWARDAGLTGPSLSWATAELLIKHGRIGCVPGVDFGPASEGYIRFCFGRERRELEGALASMKSVFTGETVRTGR